jgi:hypothetical protein
VLDTQEILMSSFSTHPSTSDRHELRFVSLFNPGRGYSFPCDACGRVDLDALSDGERRRYLYARAIVGRELSTPAVQRSDH